MSFEDLGYRIDCWLERIRYRFTRRKNVEIAPELQELVTATLRAHTSTIVESVSTSNPLLEKLKSRKTP